MSFENFSYKAAAELCCSKTKVEFPRVVDSRGKTEADFSPKYSATADPLYEKRSVGPEGGNSLRGSLVCYRLAVNYSRGWLEVGARRLRSCRNGKYSKPRFAKSLPEVELVPK